MSEQRRYKLMDDRFGRMALTLREQTGLTQSEAAQALGVSRRTIQHWEAGSAFPAGANLKGLIALYLRHNAFTPGRERAEAEALWAQADESAARRKSLFDGPWFDGLLQQAASHAPSYAASQARPEPPRQQPLPAPAPAPDRARNLLRRVDWGEAPDTVRFHGREQELATLTQWVVDDQCKVVAILGMGGIGKTTLAAATARTVASQFTAVVWRSLRNAVPLGELLADCVQTLAEQPTPALPESLEQRITSLIELLRQSRCLIVLDNVETLLEAQDLAGHYREPYEDYRRLFQRLAETAHRSCLILTSREMLSELEPFEGSHGPVRALSLAGLPPPVSQALLDDKELFGPEVVWERFVRHYAGNPLALKIAAATVRNLFGGDLEAYLHEAPVTLHTLNQLLDDQFERLSAPERDIMNLLAIGRAAVSLEELSADLAGTMSRGDLLTALQSLRRRSLVERSGSQNEARPLQGSAFALLPVVLEYVSNALVAQVADELLAGEVSLITTFALMKSQSYDYIRDSQSRMIVQPVLARMQSRLGDQRLLVAHLQRLVQQVRALPAARQGYAGGNLVNMLVCLQGHVRGWDFSGLALRQAYLQGVEAQDASLVGAQVSETRFTEPLEAIATMTLSPDGRYLAIATLSGQLRLWHVEDGKTVWTVTEVERIWALAFSAGGMSLMSGGYHGQARLWTVSGGQVVQEFVGHDAWVRAVAVHPVSYTVATAGDDATVRLWDAHSGTCLHTLSGHSGRVWSVAFSPDGAYLLSGGSDGTVRVWDPGSGTLLRTLVHTKEPSPIKLAIHPGGRLMVSAGEETGLLDIWDFHTGDCIATVVRSTSGAVSVAFNPEGTLLATGSNEGVVELWEFGDAQHVHYLKMLQAHRTFVNVVTFAAGDLLATASSASRVRLWNAWSGKVLKTIQGYSRLMSAVNISSDSCVLAQGDDNGIVRVWDVEQGCCLSAAQEHTGSVWAVAFSPDGKHFATAGDDRAVKLWQTGSGQCFKTLAGHRDMVWALAFSPDGTLLASGGADREVRLWEAGGQGATAAVGVLRGPSDWIWSLTFAPDGHMLASGHENGEVQLWSVVGRRHLRTLQHSDGPVAALRFSADGKTLLSSSHDAPMIWWEVETGRRLQAGPQSGVKHWGKGLTLSQDGALLAAAAGDRTVELWRVEQGTVSPFARLAEHTGKVWCVALSADHRILVSCDDEGTVIVSDTQTGAVLHRLSPDRPYERMNISAIAGVSPAQRSALLALGATEMQLKAET